MHTLIYALLEGFLSVQLTPHVIRNCKQTHIRVTSQTIAWLHINISKLQTQSLTDIN
jgi:hypothetical protein